MANECDKFKDFRYGITEELEEIICDVETNVNTAFMKCKCFSKKLFRNLIKTIIIKIIKALILSILKGKQKEGSNQQLPYTLWLIHYSIKKRRILLNHHQ